MMQYLESILIVLFVLLAVAVAVISMCVQDKDYPED
jgi:hypothetical protein